MRFSYVQPSIYPYCSAYLQERNLHDQTKTNQPCGSNTGTCTCTYVVGENPKNNDPKKDDNKKVTTGNNGTKGNTQGKSSTSKTFPKTGDTTNAAGYGLTLILSLAVAVGAFFKRKKKAEK